MTAPAVAPGTGRDPIGLGLLIGGVALAAIAAFAMPAVHFRGADASLMGFSAWEAVPWLTLGKLAFLGFAIFAAFSPRLAAIRLTLAVAAAFMMFLPACAAFIAALHQGSDLRAAIMEVSGQRTPWIDPGWGLVTLLVAAAMVMASVWRDYQIRAAA
jgi:hypothetical protein